MNLVSANAIHPAIDRIALKGGLKTRWRLRQARRRRLTTIKLEVAVYHRPVPAMWLRPFDEISSQKNRAAIDFVKQTAARAGLKVDRIKVLSQTTGVRAIHLRELLYTAGLPWKEYHVSYNVLEMELSLV